VTHFHLIKTPADLASVRLRFESLRPPDTIRFRTHTLTNQRKICDRFALVLAAFLVIEGVWELFSPIGFCLLTLNTLHGVVHILLDVVGLWLDRTDRGYCILAFCPLVVGVLRFFPLVASFRCVCST